MATVETHSEMVPPAESRYDGFISYSHSADDLLAPRLQAGLQRFAKPWWKRRALRIFRDEASLSANPHLWSSIVEAMDASGWLVLLLSPDAAGSEWVNREIEYWLEHKDRDRILPVVTNGGFAWSDDDVAGTAVPSELHRAFSDEPRWVDLRFASTEEQLDLNNASFRAAVADIASAIRGIPKDELESEEVRQHRRTRRTVAVAGIALLALTIAAVGAASIAIDRGNEATDQRLAAEENAAEADAQRQIAEQQTAFAQQLAADARADALAANAVAQLETNPELALLLALESLQREAQPAAFSAMHQALQRHRVLFQVAAPASVVPRMTPATGGIGPDGTRLAVTGHGRQVDVWEVGGDDPLWTFETPLEDGVLYASRFTTDGSAVVVALAPQGAFDPFRTEEPPPIDRLYVLDAQTGREIRSLPLPPCGWLAVPSPMAPFVELTAPIPWETCGGVGEGLVPTDDILFADVGLLDPMSGAFESVATVASNFLGAPTTDDQGRRFAIAAGGPGQVLDLATGDVVFSYDFGVSTLSSDGSRVLAKGGDQGLELWDLATGEREWRLPRFVTSAWFSSDELQVYATSLDGSTYVLDAITGQQVLQLLEPQETFPVEATMSLDGGRLATLATDRNARVWSLAPMTSEGATYAISSRPREHTTASADVAGHVVAVWGGATDREEADWETTVIDLNSGETLASVAGGVPALSPDGARLAYLAVERVAVTAEDLRGRGEPGVHPRVGPVKIIDLTSGGLILEIDVPCPAFLMPTEVVPVVGCFFAPGTPRWDLEFSSDGSLLAMADPHDIMPIVWDANTGQTVDRPSNANQSTNAIALTPDQRHVVIATDRLRIVNLESSAFVGSIAVGGGTTVAEMVFTPDGSLLIVADSNGDLALVDATTWQQFEAIQAHRGGVLDAAVNPAGTLIASSGPDGFIRVWRLEDRSLTTEISFEVDEIANVEFIDDTHLFVTAGFGSDGIVITLDPVELIDVATTRLFRGFTDAECVTFELDPCPSLDDLKGP